MKRCDFVDLGDGDRGFICSSRRKLPNCEFCRRRSGENQCDYPIGGKCSKCSGAGVRTPSKREKLFEASFQNAIAWHLLGRVEDRLNGLAHAFPFQSYEEGYYKTAWEFVRVLQATSDNRTSFDEAKAREGLDLLYRSFKCHPCAGTGRQQCNRYFCGTTCGVRVSEDEGYCPDHLERAGKTKPIIKERCFWIEESKYDGKCLRASCQIQIAVGDRVLYFPERRRVMDAECGDQYLKVAVEPT